VGQLDLRLFVTRRGEKDQAEAALLIVVPPHLLEAKQLEEADRRIGIRNPNHGVEIFHRDSVKRSLIGDL
jgi:hypothetical protein